MAAIAAVDGMPLATSLAMVGPDKTATVVLGSSALMICDIRTSFFVSIPLVTLSNIFFDKSTFVFFICFKTPGVYCDGIAKTIRSADVNALVKSASTVSCLGKSNARKKFWIGAIFLQLAAVRRKRSPKCNGIFFLCEVNGECCPPSSVAND